MFSWTSWRRETSFGNQSLELDRPFIKFSLGGIRDESEIRGHRRTYRFYARKIIQSFKKSKYSNPLFY